MYQSARIRRGKMWEPAVITGTHKVPRSFIVTTPQDGVYRRNRRHLLPTSEPPPNNLGPDHDEEIVVPEPRSNSVVEPQPVRRTSNRAVRLPERLRNDYMLWNDYLKLFTFININIVVLFGSIAVLARCSVL